MRLPTFLLIGAAKAGTSSLHRYLGTHPDVFMSTIKEPNFFALEGRAPAFESADMRDRFEGKLVTDLDSYRALFSGVTRERAIGEASSWYLHSRRAAERIKHHIPDVRLIAVLRDPSERALSAYRMNVREGLEPCASFEEALSDQPNRRTWSWGLEFLEPGFYHRHLSRYFKLFDRRQIQVHLHEDLDSDPATTVSAMFAFLDVDPGFRPPNLSDRHNVSAPGGGRYGNQGLLEQLLRPRTRHVGMKPETRHELIALYRDDIVQLQSLIGWDLSSWLT